MTTTLPTLAISGLCLAGMVLIGIWAWRRTRDFDDFVLGRRSLNPLVMAVAAGASDISGWMLMGLPGACTRTGPARPGSPSGWRWAPGRTGGNVAARLRICTERAHDALTLPD